MSDLITKTCTPCEGGTLPLGSEEITAHMAQVHPDWRLVDGKLERRVAVNGFAPALMLANAAGFLGEREGHHPDVAFGWGWCVVTYWTHAIGGLSENDFICAAKLDALIKG